MPQAPGQGAVRGTAGTPASATDSTARPSSSCSVVIGVFAAIALVIQVQGSPSPQPQPPGIRAIVSSKSRRFFFCEKERALLMIKREVYITCTSLLYTNRHSLSPHSAMTKALGHLR